MQQKFKPVEVAREALKISPVGSKKSQVKFAKASVVEEVNSSCLNHLQSLKRQGQLSRCTSPSCALICSRVVQSLADEQLKFAINTAVDVLPHNANLCLWKKREDPHCPLCHGNQSLLHILNNCCVVRDAQRYNVRHDSIPSTISDVVRRHIPSTLSLTVDIGSTYNFPLHIVATDLQPGLVWWDEARKRLPMV